MYNVYPTLLVLSALLLLPATACVTFEFTATASVHSPLTPVIQWDLLAAIPNERWKDIRDEAVWRWMFGNSGHRELLIKALGGATPSPLTTERNGGILDISIRILPPPSSPPPSPYHWFTLACRSDATLTECHRQLLALGHPDAHFPIGLYGFSLISERNGSTELWVDPTSLLWNPERPEHIRLSGWHMAPQHIRLLYCYRDQPAMNVDRQIEQLVVSRGTEHHLHRYPVVPHDDTLCIDTHANTDQGGDVDDETKDEGVTCQLCFSSRHYQHVIYLTTPQRHALKRIVARVPDNYYIALRPPFDVHYGAERCRIVVHRELSKQLIESVTFTRTSNYSIYLQNVARRAADALSNVHASATPEMDFVQAVWIFFVATVIVRRAVSRDVSLAIVQITESLKRGVSETERIVPVSRTLLSTDAVLLISFLATLVWYLISLSTSLPPPPTHACFTVVAVLACFHGLGNIACTWIVSLHAYPSILSCIGHSFMRIFFCAGRGRLQGNDWEPWKHRRTWIWVSLLQRVSGFVVGISTLLYGIWWNTDNVFDWALVTILVALLIIVLLDHAIYAALVAISIHSMPLAIYTFIMLAFAVTTLVTGVINVIHPFFVNVAGSIYPSDTLNWIIWICIAIIIALMLDANTLAIDRTRVLLHQRAKQKKKM